jgi:hypothetical protein
MACADDGRSRAIRAFPGGLPAARRMNDARIVRKDYVRCAVGGLARRTHAVMISIKVQRRAGASNDADFGAPCAWIRGEAK